MHSDNAHWSGLAFEAVITKAGPLALRTMAILPKSVRWRVPALQTLNFNEKTPRERTQSGILCGKEKERNFGLLRPSEPPPVVTEAQTEWQVLSAVLDNSCFPVRTYRHEPMREHLKSAHHNCEKASKPRTHRLVIQGCGATVNFRSIF